MSLEFSASRLLIPVFGSSIYTWGSLIGVILAGLTLGYHIGGRMADNINPSFPKLCSIIFSAGLYIVFIPFISTPIIGASYPLVTTVTSFYNRDITSSSSIEQSAALVASIMLLIVPTFLLGIISPYAVKLATKTLSKLGITAGNLYSAATIGSIIGTFLTVFVLIPAFDVRTIIFGLGLSLIISSVITGLGKVPNILAGAIILFLFLSNTFLVLSPVSYYSGNLVFQRETPYSHLDVVDSEMGNKRALYLDGYIHTLMNNSNPTQLLTYTRYFPLGFLFNPSAKHVLFVGGGGFSGPKYFLKTFPNVAVDVVEIDPVVIDVAKKYFYVNDKDSRLSIYKDDARNFLQSLPSNTKNSNKYDIIVLDAYSKDYVPFHLMTLEYYQLLYNKLSSPNGVIVSNQVGSLVEGEDTSSLYRAAYKTMSKVFPNVEVFASDIQNPELVQNIILIGSKNLGLSYSKNEISQKEQQLTGQPSSTIAHTQNSTNYVDYARDLFNPPPNGKEKIKVDDVPLLTDQFAPVENLLNPITGRPFNVEEKQIPGNTKIDMSSSEGTALTTVPFIIVALWIWNIQKIWRLNEKKQQKNA